MSKARRWALVFVGASSLAACAPLTPGPPFHFLETAQVQKKDEVAVTVGGGGGWIGLDGAGGGGTARVRIGVGHDQEVGIEGTALGIDHSWSGEQKYVSSPSAAFAGKLAYKWAMRPWMALLGGVGGSSSATGLGLGADLGVVLSCARCTVVRPYAGGRFSFGVPVDHPTHSEGGITPALIGAVGLAIPIGRVQFLMEGGGLVAWSEHEPDPPKALDHTTDQHLGVYGAVALTIPVR